MGLIETQDFRWHRVSRSWLRDWRAPLVWALVTVIPGAGFLFSGKVFYGVGILVLFVAAVPPLIRPRARVQICGAAVEVRQKRWLVNTYCMFPIAFGLGAILMTCEVFLGASKAVSVRYVFVVACAYIAALLTIVLWWRFRGSLRITGSELTIGKTYKLSYDGFGMEMTPARTGGFPYLTLSVAGDAKTRNLYPTMSYGLEANSVYSTLRHLAETDEETRRNYSPELIREMLLFAPDREIEVGESIEVRIVAQPQASTA